MDENKLAVTQFTSFSYMYAQLCTAPWGDWVQASRCGKKKITNYHIEMNGEHWMK